METTNKTVKIVSRNHKYATTWGGSIWEGDFVTCAPVGNTAEKIAGAWTFDKQCKKNIADRAKRK